MAENKELQDWIQRIELAKDVRNDYEKLWEKNYESVFGNSYKKKQDSYFKNNPNRSMAISYDYDLLLSFLKTELPSLSLTTPEVYLTPRRMAEALMPDSQKQVKKIEDKVNTILGDMDDLNTELRCMLTDAFCAYGILKVIKSNVLKAHPQAGAPVLDEQGMILSDPETNTPLVYPDIISLPSYAIHRVSPFDFLIDHRARNSKETATWVGEQIGRTIEELKLDGIYEQEIIDKIESHMKKDNPDKKDWEIEVTLYEVYDRVNDEVIVICDEWRDDFLRKTPTPDGIEKDTYVVVKFTEIPGQWFPKTEVESGILYQEEYKKGRELISSWAKKAVPQLGIKRSFHDADAIEADKLKDGTSDYVVVNSESDVFVLNKDALTANTSLKEHIAIGMKDFDQIMGQPSQDRGMVGGAKFATEASIAEAQGNIREMDKNRIIRSCFAKMVEKLIMLIRFNKSEDEDIRNLALNVDLDIEIDVQSRADKTRAIDRKQLMEALTVVSSSPYLMQSPTLLDQIFRNYDLREKDKIISEIMEYQRQAQEAQAQAQIQAASVSHKLNLSLLLKHELLPPEAVDKILDIVMKDDIPIVSMVQEDEQRKLRPAMNESISSGTEGIRGGGKLATGKELI